MYKWVPEIFLLFNSPQFKFFYLARIDTTDTNAILILKTVSFLLDDRHGTQVLILLKTERSTYWLGTLNNWNIANICKCQMCFTSHLITFY